MLQCRICMFEVSHLGFLFHFEELGHVGEIFLVGFSHLLLCSLWVHNLQALQTRADKRWDDDKNLTVNALLLNWFLPEEEWKLHWSWFLRSDLWLWTFLRTSCSASATFSVVNDRRDSIEDHEGKKKRLGRWREKKEALCQRLPAVIWRSSPWWPRWPEPAGLCHCRSSPADPDWSPDPPDRRHLRSATSVSLISVTTAQQAQNPTFYASLCARVFFITTLLTFNPRLRAC